MKRLRTIHLYLSCVFAPALLFFAITGSWQLYNLHRSTKDGSYVAPRMLHLLSSIHQDQTMPPTPRLHYTPLRTFMLLAAIGLVSTTILGVVMAFRTSRSFITPLLCLVAGIAIPVGILMIYG